MNITLPLTDEIDEDTIEELIEANEELQVLNDWETEFLDDVSDKFAEGYYDKDGNHQDYTLSEAQDDKTREIAAKLSVAQRKE